MNQPQSSGMFNPPQYLAAPQLLEFDDGAIVKNIYCYVLRHYGNEGIGVLYYRHDEDICIQFGDWNGNPIDMDQMQDPLVQLAHLYLYKYNTPIYNLLHTIKIPQSQVFLNQQLMMVDLQIAVNKLTGPGMLQNLFSKIIRTPEVLGIEIIDERAVDTIKAGTGMYIGDIILKPSRFRHYQLPNMKYTPLHVQVVR